MTTTAPPRTRREARTVKPRSQRIVVCWGTQGSGKSTIALSLAANLAASGARVLLVDADIQSPSLATALALSEHPAGLAPLLRFARLARLGDLEFATQSAVLKFGRAKFTFVPGITPARWPEVTPGAFQQLLEYCREHFDFVIVDTATSIEAEIFANHSPQGRNDFTRWLLAAAETLVVSLGADPISITRFLQLEPQLAELRQGGETSIVVNYYRSRAIGAGAKSEIVRTIKTLTGRRVTAFLDYRPKQHDIALRDGTPIGIPSLSKLVSWPHSPSN